MIVYETPTVSPTYVEMLNASEQGEEDEADHMDTEVQHLLTLEEMVIREKAQEEELKRKHEAEEARLEEMEQARLDERIRMEESRKAEEAAKLAEENRLQEDLKKQKEEEEAKLAEETRLQKESKKQKEAEAMLAEELRLKAEADKLAEEQRLKDEAAKVIQDETKDKPESSKGDDKDTTTHNESSQSSPPASESTQDKSIKKPSRTKVSAASKVIKKVVKRVRDKGKIKLEKQVESLASQVAELTKQMTNVQQMHKKVDTFLAKDVQEDMETTLAAQVNQYLDQHLVAELKDLLAPVKGELTKIAEQPIKKVIRTTSFTLRADKSTLPQQELTMDELETQLFDKLASKFTLSSEETKVREALRAKYHTTTRGSTHQGGVSTRQNFHKGKLVGITFLMLQKGGEVNINSLKYLFKN
jgi:hypothetical protein